MFNSGGVSNHAQVGFRIGSWGPIGTDRQNKMKNVFVLFFKSVLTRVAIGMIWEMWVVFGNLSVFGNEYYFRNTMCLGSVGGFGNAEGLGHVNGCGRVDGVGDVRGVANVDDVGSKGFC